MIERCDKCSGAIPWCEEHAETYCAHLCPLHAAASQMLHQLSRVVEAIDAGLLIEKGSQLDGKIRNIITDAKVERSTTH